jgi:hypothetical protein
MVRFGPSFVVGFGGPAGISLCGKHIENSWIQKNEI